MEIEEEDAIKQKRDRRLEEAKRHQQQHRGPNRKERRKHLHRDVDDEDARSLKKKKPVKLSKGVKRKLNEKSHAKMRELRKSIHELIESQKPPPEIDANLFADRDPATFFAASSRFSQLPLSQETKRALEEASFSEMTSIQRAAIPQALSGRSVLGTAKTGSGKTLAFLVPLVERLWREGWDGQMDGVGAIVVSPTRELAMQTFEVLKVVAKYHSSLQGGLMIGKGLDWEQEKQDVSSYGVIVCTPGRLLQHLDESYGFRCDSLKVIVFDECDRLLDMGFQTAIDAIMQHLPPVSTASVEDGVNGTDGLQCLMFSATNNRRLVNERLPEAAFVDCDPHRTSKSATPNSLQHYVMHTTLDKKLTMLWSFLKQHFFSKTMIFVASCKQARFLEEILRRLQVGPMWIAAIHGRLQQTKRMAKYYEFRSKRHGTLICTDVAARGLDFPAVDWVIQMDCPDDAESYIHRVGRTARLGGSGSALLFLLPSEKAFMGRLLQKGIVLQDAEPNEKRLVDPMTKFQSLLSEDADLKYLAQKAFVCYMRSVYLAADKEVFNVESLPYREFASSMGLITVPKIKFGKSKRIDKNTPYALRDQLEKGTPLDQEQEGDEKIGKKTQKKKPVSEADRIMKSKGKTNKALVDLSQSDEDSDDFLVPKRMNHELDEKQQQKRARNDSDEDEETQKNLKKAMFADAGEEDGEDWSTRAAMYKEELRDAVRVADVEDKKNAKERRKEKRRLEKQKRKEEQKAKRGDAGGVVALLGGNGDEEMDDDNVDDVDEEMIQEVPKSLKDREAMAMAMLGL